MCVYLLCSGVDRGADNDLTRAQLNGYQHIRIEIAQLLRCIHTDKHLLEYMESSDFPLMKEYQELRRHYISLTKDRSSSTRELRQAV